MFERYTEKARRVIFFARYEASQYGSPYIETEHLLLGLIREEPRLLNWGPAIRREIEAEAKPRERISTSVEVPLSQECKRILNFALEEANKMHRQRVEPSHLLLGILREEKCLAALLLARRGVVLDELREKIGNQMPADMEPSQAPGPRIKSERRASSQARLGTTVDSFLEAWRARDPKKLASLFVAHGQFWDVRGEMWLTPGQIEKGLAAHFASAEPMELALDVRDVKFVTADVSAVTFIWKPEVEVRQRNALEPRMILILQEARPGWFIVTAHLALLQPGRSANKPKR